MLDSKLKLIKLDSILITWNLIYLSNKSSLSWTKLNVTCLTPSLTHIHQSQSKKIINFLKFCSSYFRFFPTIPSQLCKKEKSILNMLMWRPIKSKPQYNSLSVFFIFIRKCGKIALNIPLHLHIFNIFFLSVTRFCPCPSGLITSLLKSWKLILIL